MRRWLFDPFEKQFCLPTALIDLGDGQCWKQKVVGQELESLLCFDIEITDSAQGIGIGFRGIDGGQNDGVNRIAHLWSCLPDGSSAAASKTFSLVRTTKNAEQSVNTNRRSKSM